MEIEKISETSGDFKQRSMIRRRLMNSNYHEMIELMEVLFDIYDARLQLYEKGGDVDQDELHDLNQQIESLHYQITELRESYSVIEDNQLKDERSENIELL